MAHMTAEQRKSFHFVERVLLTTLVNYGAARLDCGDVCDARSPEFHLREDQSGMFFAYCRECAERLDKPKIEPDYRIDQAIGPLM